MPAVLGRMLMPALRRSEAVIIRFASITGTPQTKPGIKQLVTNEVGYCRYERDWSRDSKKPNPQKPGDTPMRFLLHRLDHAYEVYPLIALMGVWVVILVYTIYISFEKIEVWVDKSHALPPWDWERARDKYWKYHTLIFDPSGKTHQRLPIMEQIQDEMLEAAKRRGTR